jgi:hypothetical protein
VTFRTGKPITGLHLVKVFDGPTGAEDDKQADDVVDLLREVQRGASTDYKSKAEEEDETRGEREFFLALARKIDERLWWARGKARIVELGTRDGWSIGLHDREGRPYEVQITYSELAEVAILQRVHDSERGPDVMCGHICDQLEAARKRYYDRAGLS